MNENHKDKDNYNKKNNNRSPHFMSPDNNDQKK